MTANARDKLLSLFSLQHGELRLLALGVLFVFSLFLAYALLRPIRDALGIQGGTEELKWLFAATFVATLLCSLAAMWVSGRVRRRLYTDAIFAFFAVNLLLFFVAMKLIGEEDAGFAALCRVFYVWVSVFNLAVISSGWSVLADVFNREQSQRMFGILSAGASLGSIAGSAAVGILQGVASEHFIFLSAFLLLFALWLKNALMNAALALVAEENERARFQERFSRPLPTSNPLQGLRIIAASSHLRLFVGFVLLLTSVSTFLYMEQGRVVYVTFTDTQARRAAFADIELIVQAASFFIQIFLTAKIARHLGMKWLLGLLGFVVAAGFALLAWAHPAFWAIALVMSVRRIGEYALVKPAREMLFVPLGAEEKYKVKNFLDTVVYRGGDMLSAQAEGWALARLGAGGALLLGGALSALWGALGLKLGGKYESERIHA